MVWGVEVKLWKCVYPLPSPYKHTDISHSNPPPRHHVEVFAYTDRDLSICAMNKWWTTNVGEAPSTDWRLYYLPVEMFMNTVTAGEGERPLESNQLPVWAACLLFATSWYLWTWSVMRECGLCGDDERWGFSKVSSSPAITGP